VKSQPHNDFFGRVGFGRVVFWSSCLLGELLIGRVGFSQPVVVELSFGRVVAHSVVERIANEDICYDLIQNQVCLWGHFSYRCSRSTMCTWH
jgi:hypothetical protein